MTSKAQGYVYVLAWCDDGVIKPLADDNGHILVKEQTPLTELDVTIKASDITVPVEEQTPLTELDVTIKASDITVPVEEQSPLTSIQAQGYGWDTSNWRKLALLWGYTDNWAAAETIANAAAGYNAITIQTVPTGYVYVVEYVNAVDVNNAPTRILIDAVIDGNGIILKDDTSPVANYYTYEQVHVTLKATDYLRVRFWGCTLNDDLWGKASGYMMKVNE